MTLTPAIVDFMKPGGPPRSVASSTAYPLAFSFSIADVVYDANGPAEHDAGRGERLPLAHDEMRGEVGGGPALTQGGGVGPEPLERVAQRGALGLEHSLGIGSGAHDACVLTDLA